MAKTPLQFRPGARAIKIGAQAVACAVFLSLNGCFTTGLWGGLGKSPVSDMDARDVFVPKILGIREIGPKHLCVAMTAPSGIGFPVALDTIEVPQVRETGTGGAAGLTTFYGGSGFSLPALRSCGWRAPSKHIRAESDPASWSAALPAETPPHAWIMAEPGAKAMNLPEGMAFHDGSRSFRIEYGLDTEKHDGFMTYSSRILLTPATVAADIVTSPLQLVLLVVLRSHRNDWPKG